MDFTQLISKLTELSQSSTQRFPDQVSGTEKAKAIRVLGAEQDPDNSFQGRLVGADESVDQSLSEDLIAQLTQEFADFLRDKQPVMDNVFPAAQDRELSNKPEDRELAVEASLIQQPAQPAAKTAQPAAQQPAQPVTQQPAVKPAQPAAQQPEITNIAGQLSKLLGMDATQLKAAYQAPNPNPRQLGVLADAFKKLAAIGPVEKAKAMTLLKQISSEETGTIQELTEGWKPKNKAKHKSCQQSVKNRVSVWPSAYASAQVVQCYYGKKKRKKKISEAEEYAGKGQGMLGVKNITGYLDDGEKIPLMNLKDHYINRVPDSSALRLIEKIKSDCSNYIDILKRTKNRLYRGTKPFGNVYVGKSRTDRKPKDSDPILATELDRQMKAKGLTATRSNSIFVSSNIGHARAYGYPYLIIPKNTATFTWSKVYGDIWLSTSVHNKIDVDDFKFTQDHLETAMISGHEIMISGEYYAIYYSTPDMNFESQMITRDFIKRILGQTTGDI